MAKSESVEGRILEWARDKGIFDKSDAIRQFEKLLEEIEELYSELIDEDTEKAKMELGDVLVVSTLLACFLGSSMEDCMELALNKITKRKGKMVNGLFVKD